MSLSLDSWYYSHCYWQLGHSCWLQFLICHWKQHHIRSCVCNHRWNFYCCSLCHWNHCSHFQNTSSAVICKLLMKFFILLDLLCTYTDHFGLCMYPLVNAIIILLIILATYLCVWRTISSAVWRCSHWHCCTRDNWKYHSIYLQCRCGEQIYNKIDHDS